MYSAATIGIGTILKASPLKTCCLRCDSDFMLFWASDFLFLSVRSSSAPVCTVERKSTMLLSFQPICMTQKIQIIIDKSEFTPLTPSALRER
ncbi:hypothetical protein FOQG_13220 [Fusarium oxysporum f. sp. raphani 54005]|uniref:Uncharacterized protein n=2 Tax=Fusarium oxysporum TaxID=5507 RepID=X0BVH1_FUSOX|nr:hypothetical protein FOVG_12820 [Fusarium oxysporum f. sp. pisi HDV247]EXK82509.1 hypothetical protein FOQG_13220 [Fusarium oxysporum f. sp. raphani 54005]